MSITFPKPKKDPLRPFQEKMEERSTSFSFSGDEKESISLVEGVTRINLQALTGSNAALNVEAGLPESIFAKVIIEATVEKDSRLDIFENVSGGSRIETELVVHLAGEGSESNVIAKFHGTNQSHHGFSVIMFHESPNTKGNIKIRGVYEQESRAVFSGLIKVAKHAQKTNSYFRDDVLLLDQALAESLPTLEIEANDVKASHGSTTSRINDEQLFYLGSRGINSKDARKMIIDGFLEIKKAGY